MNGRFKLASTATPIENSISELWSILDYSNAGYLESLREFNRKYGVNADGEVIEELRERLNPIVSMLPCGSPSTALCHDGKPLASPQTRFAPSKSTPPKNLIRFTFDAAKSDEYFKQELDPHGGPLMVCGSM